MQKTLWLALAFFLVISACATPATVAPTTVPTKISATSTPNIDSIKVSEKDGMKLLYVPAGKFTK